ncbi:hypothetical protein SAMN06298216_4137 [Spirosomataceae bacterium TFI 002]|nr:hypothetical protein SAMN06298216_4137 [Spirosomataceae bacterium TFI 002]
MNKITLNLIIGILGIGTLIYSFYGMGETTTLFTFEINIWVYRLIWAVVTVGSFYEHFKKAKQNND